MMSGRDTNVHFHQELENLERRVLTMADTAEKMVGMAVAAAATGDMALAGRVIELDRSIDDAYVQVHNDWTNLVARNQPMGSDLRKMAVLLQLNITFERMGDQTVNIAKIAQFNEALPRAERIVEKIQEMADLVRPMIRTATDAYVKLDLELAKSLHAMDEPVDRLNANMYKETVAVADNPAMLEWATKMLMAARALERIGDQCVDFAEQTVYLITGETVSFTKVNPSGLDDVPA